jgi:hypothetical protein
MRALGISCIPMGWPGTHKEGSGTSPNKKPAFLEILGSGKKAGSKIDEPNKGFSAGLDIGLVFHRPSFSTGLGGSGYNRKKRALKKRS